MRVNIQFDKVLGSSVFHLLVGKAVYRITCPREGIYGGSDSGRDGYDFRFQLESLEPTRNVTVQASRTMWCCQDLDENKTHSILRAARKAIELGQENYSLDSVHYKSFLTDNSRDETTKEVRDSIVKYVLDRYELKFDVPFSVVEITTAIQSSLSSIINELHYLHKHEYVSFNWGSEVWQERKDHSQWMIEEFSITNTNLKSLKDFGLSEVVMPMADNTHREWDCFICHASEDKRDVVEPLAGILEKEGFHVWYDDWTLVLGDSLRRRIDDGLLKSRYGIVIISKSFFEKEWTQKEFDGLIQKEISGQKVILPVWHNVTIEFVKSKSLMLADKFAVFTNQGIPQVARKIIDVLKSDPDRRSS